MNLTDAGAKATCPESDVKPGNEVKRKLRQSQIILISDVKRATTTFRADATSKVKAILEDKV